MPTRPEVAKAIRSLKDYVGITGTFGFTQNGDPTTVRYFVKQAVTADPEKWGDNPVVATFELPPPK